ncbi:TauD/TfdA family dioxygenase [Streptomyces sp. NPDC001890]|uniref:TauD/TfdA family dioxygenase n=1 Tax=Streptomyces sp. NPDC001890 TaxID=3364620 RepID=UPI00367CEC5D
MLTCLRTTGSAAPCSRQQIAGAGGIAEQLCERGLVTVNGLTSRKAVHDFTQRIMSLVPHRDSDPDALTTIRDIGRRAQQPGLAGLGCGELLAHTEQSNVRDPARLMLLVCHRPSVTGGESLLTDGQAIHDHLATDNPEAVEHLSLPGTAFYGDGGGHPSQIFTRHPGGRVSLRFRQDELGQFSPLVQRFLPELREAIAAHQRPIILSPGQGYLIDNHRYLHARAAFVGPREYVRALGMPLFPMRPGFGVCERGIASVSCPEAGRAPARISRTANPSGAATSQVERSVSGSGIGEVR